MPDITLHNHGYAMAHTFDESILSDLHEAAYGYRPREWFWSQWHAYSDDDKQVVWNNLCRLSFPAEYADCFDESTG